MISQAAIAPEKIFGVKQKNCCATFPPEATKTVT